MTKPNVRAASSGRLYVRKALVALEACVRLAEVAAEALALALAPGLGPAPSIAAAVKRAMGSTVAPGTREEDVGGTLAVLRVTRRERTSGLGRAGVALSRSRRPKECSWDAESSGRTGVGLGTTGCTDAWV